MNIIKSFTLTVATTLVLVLLALIVALGLITLPYPIVFFITTPIILFLIMWVFVSAVVDLVKETYND